MLSGITNPPPAGPKESWGQAALAILILPIPYKSSTGMTRNLGLAWAKVARNRKERRNFILGVFKIDCHEIKSRSHLEISFISTLRKVKVDFYCFDKRTRNILNFTAQLINRAFSVPWIWTTPFSVLFLFFRVDSNTKEKDLKFV